MTQSENRSLPVTQDAINTVERELGRKFPASLTQFWLTHGYGFYDRSLDGLVVAEFNNNRLCGPFSVKDLLADVSTRPLADLGQAIPFFDIYGGRYLYVGTNLGDDVVVNGYGDVVASDVNDLVAKLLVNPVFYDGDVEDDPDFEP